MPLEITTEHLHRYLCPKHAHYGPDEFDHDCPDCKTGAQLQAEKQEEAD